VASHWPRPVLLARSCAASYAPSVMTPPPPAAGPLRSQITLRALLIMAAVDLAYLAMEALVGGGPSPLVVAGRLALAAVLLAPAGYLLAGGEPRLVFRLGPVLVALGVAALAVIAAGQPPGLAFGYLGFLSALPLLYAVVFPEEPFGVAAAGLTLLLASALLNRHLGASPMLQVQLLGALALSTLVAVFASRLARAGRAREAAAVEASTQALRALARSEAERGQAERLAALGLLADSVAHDVNSPLASLQSNLRFALEEQASGRAGESTEALRDALACVERIKAMLGTLRTVASRPGEPQGVCDLAAAARSALLQASPQLRPGVEVQLDLPEALPAVPAAESLLVELLVQYLIAAGQGLEEGRLRVGGTRRGAVVELRALGEGAVAAPESCPAVAVAVCELQARRLGGRLEWREESGRQGLALDLPLGPDAATRGGGGRSIPTA
jgi:signal transduction histidine kinase